jgi:uncharacterized protein YndB with AHSA1/START domain
MAKLTFIKDYSLKLSPKQLFNLVSTPDGLSKWFAEDAVYDRNREIFNFRFDSSDHLARMVSVKPNKLVKFEFLDDQGNTIADPSWTELKINTSELTNEVFLTITDYSGMSDLDDLEELWDDLVYALSDSLNS